MFAKRVRACVRNLLRCVTVLILSGLPALAHSQALADLSEEGWNRDSSLHAFNIDRYRSDSGSISIDLLAFPPTDFTADEWTRNFIHHMTAPDRKEGMKVTLINNDELGGVKDQMNSSSSGVDIATYTVMISRSGKDRENLMLEVRSIIREGKPVQVSLLRRLEGKKSDEEWAASNRIRFNAQVAVKQSAAFLGLDAMISLMAGPLVHQEVQKPEKRTASQTEPVRTSASEVQKPDVRAGSQTKLAQTSADANNVVDVLYLGELKAHDILVLYNDNTARFNPAIPVDYLDVNADKNKYPKNWRQWRKIKNQVEVRGLSSTGEWFKLFDSQPTSVKSSQQDLKLSGNWNHIWTNSTLTETRSSQYWFSPKGKFKTSSSSLMGASVPGISSTIAGSSCDSSGQSTVVNSTAASGVINSSSKGKACGAANVGEYRIGGYSLVLNAENGELYRLPFYRLNADTVLINGRWYASSK